MSTNDKIPVGISQCLLGEPVRFNGGHKHLKFCTEVLANHFTFVDTCPEMNAGLGVPRKPIRLVGFQHGERAVETDDYSKDVTESLVSEGLRFAADHSEICGFIGAGGSPSCSAYSAKLYGTNGVPKGKQGGLFTQALLEQHPLLPVEDSGRLNDPGLRENFIMRVFTYHRWLALIRSGITANKLIEFHSKHKYLLMSHSSVAYKKLGKLLADAGNQPLPLLQQEYITILMTAIAKPPHRGQHCNVLHHIMGYLKKLITPQDKRELSQTIEDYRRGIVPLVVPLALLKHHLGHFPDRQQYALSQFYLSPYPYELGLRSQIF